MKTEHLYRNSKMDIETRIMKTAEDKVSNAIETTSSQAPKIRLRKPIEWISCIVSKDQCQYADMPNCTELCLDCQYESCNSFWLTFELWLSHNWRSRKTKCKTQKFCKPSLGKQGIFPKLGRKSLRAEKCRTAFFSLLGVMLSKILTNIQKANFWKCYYADLTARWWYMETCFSGKANYI